MPARKWIGALGFVALTAILAARGRWEAAESPSAAAADERTAAPSLTIAGTASCSARGCHGRLEPSATSFVHQNEYTLWLARDRHAQAYGVLFSAESKHIAENLKIPAAHEDVRCLACHTVPQTADAWVPGKGNNLQSIVQERLNGVGCEACHGNATGWIVAHTKPDWAGRGPEEKRKAGMIATADTTIRAQTCVGCHVGAPSDAALGLPVRDVNHDLIAAGHPRLNFEYAAYMANMPRHWDEKNPAASVWSGDWRVGQAVSLEAALKLLDFRAGSDDRPWPEFAEYDCYACHHDLKQPTWWQAAEHTAGRKVGTPRWGAWYTTPADLLANHVGDKGKDCSVALQRLRETMQRPIPDREAVRKQTADAMQRLADWRQSTARIAVSVRVEESMFTEFARDCMKSPLSWDSATQLYLAFVARGREHPSLPLLFKALENPREFQPGEVEKILKELAEAPRP